MTSPGFGTYEPEFALLGLTRGGAFCNAPTLSTPTEKTAPAAGYAAHMTQPLVRHLHLAATDHARTTAFYQAYFGFTFQKVLDRGPGHTPATIIHGPERFQIFLEVATPEMALPAWFHFGFLLPEGECRQLYARMVEAGVRITRPLVEAPFVNFFFSDPDGHEVQVYSDPAELAG
jgi:predicted enzyme related to lactoylglutathione lyase